ncbi:uncharacterized protein [Arachis hypogaea]|uniref:uncharacterized protein n=1 Tax=Arachis hypogaea TaxID=3818 RepID=UPI003B21C0F9
MADSKEFVRKCVKCQENANFHKAPATELSLLTTSRPFSQWGVDLLGPFPLGPGQVAIDYYTKWIESEPLASISSSNCRKFMWRQVITRFGIPETVVSDNGTCLGRRTRLVFWSCRTTEQSSTRETPFRLTYGLDAVIPVEVGEPSPRLLLKGLEEAMEKDLVEETREMAHLSETALKQRMAMRYNAKILKREFERNDLVLRRNDIVLPAPGEGKLAAKWEGPYRIKEGIGKGAYKLEKLNGKEIPRTWNADNLRRFYS